jgi:hypothetical protein
MVENCLSIALSVNIISLSGPIVFMFYIPAVSSTCCSKTPLLLLYEFVCCCRTFHEGGIRYPKAELDKITLSLVLI